MYKLGYLSIGITGCRLDRQGLIPGGGKRFSLLHCVQTGSGAQPARLLHLEVMQLEHEAGNSPPFCAGAKNVGTMLPHLHASP
jgi:hypothetical protein